MCTFRYNKVKREITFSMVARGLAPRPHWGLTALPIPPAGWISPQQRLLYTPLIGAGATQNILPMGPQYPKLGLACSTTKIYFDEKKKHYMCRYIKSQ